MSSDGSAQFSELGQFGTEVVRWAEAINVQSALSVLLALALLIVLRKPCARVIIELAAKLLGKLHISLSDQIIQRLHGAMEVLLVTFGLLVVLEIFAPHQFGQGILRRILLSVAVIAVFSAWYQLTGPFLSVFRSRRIADVQMEQDWITRVTQFAILLFGITSVLNVWEVDISGALTGVGVLGAGLAIAAQDLVRNLIAGMTNVSEQRFETGDSIEIDGVLIGSVKRIDLRSTLIVGFDQIPRYVPNSDLSNSVVKNYSNMEHRRVLVTVRLVMSATGEQVKAVRDALRDHLTVSGDFDLGEDAPKHVYVGEFGKSSIDILFYARTLSADYATFLQVQERLSLQVLAIVAQVGTSLAYPTQTVRLERQGDEPDTLTGRT